VVHLEEVVDFGLVDLVVDAADLLVEQDVCALIELERLRVVLQPQEARQVLDRVLLLLHQAQ